MKSVLRFNKKNYLYNISILKKLLNGKKLCLVLKSDCYGFGFKNILPLIIDKIDYIAILENEEANIIRNYSNSINILRIRPALKNEIEEGIKYNIIEIIDSKEKLELIKENFINLPIHLSIDAGMNNIGIDIDKINPKDFLKLNLLGIFTHYPDANNDNETFENKFLNLYSNLKKIYPNLVGHQYNSHKLINNLNNINYDMIRIGNLQYGMSLIKNIDLKPVLSWEVDYLNIRNINLNQSIGYCSLFKPNEKTKVLIIPIGYYNGYPIIENSCQYVMINNIKSKVIGKVSMNMIHVDITNICLPIKSIYLLGNGIYLDDIKSKYYHNGFILLNIVRNNKIEFH